MCGMSSSKVSIDNQLPPLVSCDKLRPLSLPGIAPGPDLRGRTVFSPHPDLIDVRVGVGLGLGTRQATSAKPQQKVIVDKTRAKAGVSGGFASPDAGWGQDRDRGGGGVRALARGREAEKEPDPAQSSAATHEAVWQLQCPQAVFPPANTNQKSNIFARS